MKPKTTEPSNNFGPIRDPPNSDWAWADCPTTSQTKYFRVGWNRNLLMWGISCRENLGGTRAYLKLVFNIILWPNVRSCAIYVFNYCDHNSRDWKGLNKRNASQKLEFYWSWPARATTDLLCSPRPPQRAAHQRTGPIILKNGPAKSTPQTRSWISVSSKFHLGFIKVSYKFHLSLI